MWYDGLDMPLRKVPLVTGHFYHVLNRGNGGLDIFRNRRDYEKFLEILFYYQNDNLSLRLSDFLRLSSCSRAELIKTLEIKKNFLVDILAYCLMPNHFHLFLCQKKDGGIFKFLSKLQNSYAKYFNLKRKRKGGLFESRFKAVRVVSNEQLLHLSRYIHLNPYSANLVKSLSGLKEYAYSSLPEYLGIVKNVRCQKEDILGQFKDRVAYGDFVFDEADHQRSLQWIKNELKE